MGETGQAAAPLYECRPGAATRKLRDGYQRRDVEATTLHRTVRENLATFLLECADNGGLPLKSRATSSVTSNAASSRTAFLGSCVRGAKRKCWLRTLARAEESARRATLWRAHDTAIHVAERVLPRTPVRQWTLSFPIQLRYLLA